MIVESIKFYTAGRRRADDIIQWLLDCCQNSIYCNSNIEIESFINFVKEKYPSNYFRFADDWNKLYLNGYIRINPHNKMICISSYKTNKMNVINYSDIAYLCQDGWKDVRETICYDIEEFM